jgi:carboxymethylenebutenolidase
VTRDPEEASKLMHALATEDGIATIRSAIEETKRRYNASRVGITGYCMGGTFALQAACDIQELDASAPFYCDIPDEETLSRLRVPTLFIAGERDQWITPEKVDGLKEAARKYNLPVEVVSYDADHAFFNDTRPEVYNPEAARDAWRRVLSLFDSRLRR